MTVKIKNAGLFGKHPNVYNDGVYFTRPSWSVSSLDDRKITVKDDVVTLENGEQFDAAFFFKVNRIIPDLGK